MVLASHVESSSCNYPVIIIMSIEKSHSYIYQYIYRKHISDVIRVQNYQSPNA